MKISGCTLRLRCSQVVPAFWAPMPMKSGDNGILPCALGDLVLGASGTYDGGSIRVFQACQQFSSSPLSPVTNSSFHLSRSSALFGSVLLSFCSLQRSPHPLPDSLPHSYLLTC